MITSCFKKDCIKLLHVLLYLLQITSQPIISLNSFKMVIDILFLKRTSSFPNGAFLEAFDTAFDPPEWPAPQPNENANTFNRKLLKHGEKEMEVLPSWHGKPHFQEQLSGSCLCGGDCWGSKD